MKKIVTILIIPILVLVFGGFILNKIELKQPQVVYNLTDSIPMSISEINTGEVIQQIEVLNAGSSMAKDIYVLINADVEKHQVQLANLSDKISVTEKGNTLEIKYPQLISDDKFSISLISSEQIKIDDVEVKYSEGMANYIYEENSTLKKVLLYSIIFGYLIFLFIIIFYSVRQSYNTEKNYKKLLTKDKFLFLEKEMVKEIKVRSIREYFVHEFYYLTDYRKDINKIEEQRDKIKDKEIQKKFDNIAENWFIDDLNKFINRYTSDDEKIREIINIAKPNFCSTEKWSEVRENAVKEILKRIEQESILENISNTKVYYYLNEQFDIKMSQKESNTFYIGLETIYCNRIFKYFTGDYMYKFQKQLDFIINNIPKHLTEEKWKEVCQNGLKLMILCNNPKESYRKNEDIEKNLKYICNISNQLDINKSIIEKSQYLYTAKILSEIISSQNKTPIEFEDSLLEKDDVEIIKKISYFSAREKFLKNIMYIDISEFDDNTWLNEEDETALKKFILEKEETERLKEKYENLNAILKDVLYYKFDKTKYISKVSDTDLNKAEEIYKIIQENENAKEILREKSEIVIKQLNIINEILKDPTEIKRIEKYDNPFSEKNFINLQYIAEIISKRVLAEI